ncbi:hypothetical protein RAAC3_TM7C00001G0136 [Candidatus Saccharibacteria bacterium RAAC3_TM7_1]|nr:hypothetical protein RAAC3_TM7C00001G0136 [Candidatus Saccharibacteria bacterium RAAC3_TM7_1]
MLYNYDMLGSYSVWDGILMFLMMVLIVFAIIWAVHYVSRSGSDDNALTILKKRYARGEIDKKEYEEKKAELQ